MNTVTQQLLLNTIVQHADNQVAESAIDDINTLVHQILDMGPIDGLINHLKGINWASDTNQHVVDFDELQESLDDQMGAFEQYAASETNKILAQQLAYETSRKETEAPELPSVNFPVCADGLAKLTLSDPKVQLAREYAALGFQVVDRCIVVDVDRLAQAQFIKKEIDGDRDLEAYVDTRCVVDERGRHALEIHFPSNQQFMDAIVGRLLLASNALDSSKLRVRQVEQVPPAIPGYKDITDYQRRLKMKEELTREMSSK